MFRCLNFMFLLIALLLNNITYSSSFGKDSSQIIKEQCVEILTKLNPSHVGRTEHENKYSLFAIKRGKEWTFMILDSTGFYSVRQSKKNEEIIENSQATSELLCFMFHRKTLKVKNKPKNIKGLTLSNYYRLKPSAKKIYRSAVKVQGKARYYNKTLNSPGGAGKILKKSLQ